MASGKIQGFGHCQHANAGENLIGSLGDLTCTGFTYVRDRPAHAFKDWSGPGKACFRTAHHDRQGAGNGPGLAPGDGRIQEVNATSLQIERDLPCCSRQNGAHVDRQQSGIGTRTDPGFPQHQLAHIGRIGDHRNHHVDFTGQGRRRACDTRPGAEQRFQRFGTTRPNRELMATLDQIQGHGTPHDAQPEKSDFHDFFSEKTIRQPGGPDWRTDRSAGITVPGFLQRGQSAATWSFPQPGGQQVPDAYRPAAQSPCRRVSF